MDLKEIIKGIIEDANIVANDYKNGVENEKTALLERLESININDISSVDKIISDIKNTDDVTILSILDFYINEMVDSNDDYVSYLDKKIELEFVKYLIAIQNYQDCL